MVVFWHGKAITDNRRLIKGKGRWVSNPEYKAFKEALAWECKMRYKHFNGPVSVRMVVTVGKRMDAHNLEKPIFDALETAGIVDNDKQILYHSMRAVVKKKDEDDRITIVVTEVKNG